MKIKNKLTLLFTVTVAVIIGCLNLYIYFLSRTFTHNNFYSLLKERANIAATVFLEADEVSADVIKPFQKKYLHALPQEYIRVYNDSNISEYTDTAESFNFEASLINKIREQKEYREQTGSRQTLGIYYVDNQGNFVIIASAVNESGIKNLDELRIVLLIGFVISIIALFFTGRFFTSIMLKPVSVISEQAEKISETNLHLRLSEGNKKDELAELSIVINHMLERLEHAFDLQKSFVANASHELRTPLTSIIGNIEVTLSKARTAEEYKQVLESITFQAEKLHKLTNGLLNLAQSNLDFASLRKEEIRLDEVLIELKNEMKVKHPESKIEIVFPKMPDDPSSLTILGEKNLLETALLNLMDNACKFSDGKEVISFMLLSEKDISIRISDRGIGISQNELPHLTETFYRAENARAYSGSGIGLALAEKIIQLHGGKLFISSELNKGTEVTVSFSRLN